MVCGTHLDHPACLRCHVLQVVSVAVSSAAVETRVFTMDALFQNQCRPIQCVVFDYLSYGRLLQRQLRCMYGVVDKQVAVQPDDDRAALCSTRFPCC